MERVIDVSSRGCKMRVDTGRLAIEPLDAPPMFVAFSDVAVVMLSDMAVSLTGAVLAGLADNGAVVVVCDGRHSPVGMYQPTCGHTLQTGTLLRQIQLGSHARSRLWKSVVKAKILSQGRLLAGLGVDGSGFGSLAREVLLDDSRNAEGRAAAEYWRRLGIFARRDRTAADANAMLNYGYTVIFSAAARALCAAGLNTSLGLHHCHPANAHCLASDIMEPFRVVADRAVFKWLSTHPGEYEMTRECRKSVVSEVLSSSWRTSLGEEAFFNAMGRMSVSLRSCIFGKSEVLDIPELVAAEAA